MRTSAFIAFLAFYAVVLQSTECVLYQIKPHLNSSCLEQNCLTLAQFATLTEANTSTTTQLVLLPGNHSLSTKINISEAEYFEIMGSSPRDMQSQSADQRMSIVCDSFGGIAISNSMFVSIVGIQFIGCGNNDLDGVNNFIVENSTFQGVRNSGTSLVLTNVMNATIIRSYFLSNHNGSNRHIDQIYYYSLTFRAGGAIIVSGSTLEIIKTTFEGNRADKGGAIYAENNAVINIISSNATLNEAQENGGSIMYLNSGCTATIVDSNISFNLGTTIVMCDAMLSIDSSNFTYNQEGVLNKFRVGLCLTDIFAPQTSVNSSISINLSHFYNNKAQDGGVINAQSTNITIEKSVFTLNSADQLGGVILSYDCFVNIVDCIFNNNSAVNGGAIMTRTFVQENYVTFISNSSFTHNSAGLYGGAFSSSLVPFHINFCLFQYNFGAAVKMVAAGGQEFNTTITNSVFRYHNFSVLDLQVGSEYRIDNCTFEFNSVTIPWGIGYGVIVAIYSSLIFSQSTFRFNYFMPNVYTRYTNVTLIGNNTFQNNTYPLSGGIFLIRGGSITSNDTLRVMNNTARSSVVLIFDCSVHFSGNTVFENNHGSFYVYSSNVTFLGNVVFTNQHDSSDITLLPFNTGKPLQVGGAITSIFSNLHFHGSIMLAHNSAKGGGALLSISSQVTFTSDSTILIANNTALENGGGMSFYKSLFTIFGNCTLDGNSAQLNGGGLHLVGTQVTLASDAASPTHYLALNRNTANRGGGVYLETNSHINIRKSTDTDITITISLFLNVTNNIATYGGGLFISDETSTGICNSTLYTDTPLLSSECFIQEIDAFELPGRTKAQTRVLFMSNNSASSGSNIFGGLLDRCTVGTASSLNVNDIVVGSIQTNRLSVVFREIDDLDTIASDSVRVCFCLHDQPNCSYNHPPISVRRGEPFRLSVVAVDQVNHTVEATIISRVSSTADLGDGQRFQRTNTNCTVLERNVFSSADSEQLLMYTDGPCRNAVPSQASVDIIFLPCECPIGFEPLVDVLDTRCECVCNSSISVTISNCNASTGDVMKTNDYWIDYTNTTTPSGFIMHPHCPYDYCLPVLDRSRVLVNFNSGAEGTDSQCNYNRASTLCGACKDNFTLSLGSSLCLSCPSYWPALTLAILLTFVLGGLIFVALLFVLNVTVAIGTINGLLFYANVVEANKSIFFTRVSFPSIFISWFNLELGFDVCFFDGMDAHEKAWVEFLLPTYFIVIVVAIIVVSNFSQKFSNLIGRRNPVAILATLILLSYSRYLQSIIVALSFAVLSYPDGSRKLLWLPDATLGYFAGSRIPLFVTATVILIIGLLYTFILFLWMWIIRYSQLKLVRNHKLQSFIEAYTAPFNDKHRYWTGLLLLARVILYLTSAVNVSGDPQVPLVATATITAGLLLLKGLLGVRVYRQWIIDVIETTLYFNLLFLSMITSYNIERNGNREITTTLSVVIAFVLFVGVIAYHIYTYVIHPFLKNRLPSLTSRKDRVRKESVKSTSGQPPLLDDNSDRFHDVVYMFDSPSTADYENNDERHNNLLLQGGGPTSSTLDPPQNM